IPLNKLQKIDKRGNQEGLKASGKLRGNLSNDAKFFDTVYKSLTEEHFKLLDATPFRNIFKAFRDENICKKEHNHLTDEVLSLLAMYNEECFLTGNKKLKFTDLDLGLILGMTPKGEMVDFRAKISLKRTYEDLIVKMFPSMKGLP
ncbi:hypothetical protein FRX31_018051, partial [Thalictrum thalictroides]